MPAPAVYVLAIVGTVGAVLAFKEFVYEPHIAPAFDRWKAEYLAAREARRRSLSSEIYEDQDDVQMSETRQKSYGRFNDKYSDDEEEDDGKRATSTSHNFVRDGLLIRRPAVPAKDEMHSLIAPEISEWRSEVTGQILRQRKNVSMDESIQPIPYAPLSPSRTHVLLDSSPSTPGSNSRLPSPPPPPPEKEYPTVSKLSGPSPVNVPQESANRKDSQSPFSSASPTLPALPKAENSGVSSPPPDVTPFQHMVTQSTFFRESPPINAPPSPHFYPQVNRGLAPVNVPQESANRNSQSPFSASPSLPPLPKTENSVVSESVNRKDSQSPFSSASPSLPPLPKTESSDVSSPLPLVTQSTFFRESPPINAPPSPHSTSNSYSQVVPSLSQSYPQDLDYEHDLELLSPPSSRSESPFSMAALSPDEAHRALSPFGSSIGNRSTSAFSSGVSSPSPLRMSLGNQSYDAISPGQAFSPFRDPPSESAQSTAYLSFGEDSSDDGSDFARPYAHISASSARDHGVQTQNASRFYQPTAPHPSLLHGPYNTTPVVAGPPAHMENFTAPPRTAAQVSTVSSMPAEPSSAGTRETEGPASFDLFRAPGSAASVSGSAASFRTAHAPPSEGESDVDFVSDYDLHSESDFGNESDVSWGMPAQRGAGGRA